VALLLSRLLVLDPGAIKPNFSQKLSELLGLRMGFLGKGDKAPAANTPTLLDARSRLSARKGL